MVVSEKKIHMETTFIHQRVNEMGMATKIAIPLHIKCLCFSKDKNGRINMGNNKKESSIFALKQYLVSHKRR